MAELSPLSRVLKVFEGRRARSGSEPAASVTKGEQLDRFGRQPGPDRSAEERAVLLTWVEGWLDEGPAAARSGLTFDDRGEAYVTIRAGLEKLCAVNPDGEFRERLERMHDVDASLLSQDSPGLQEYQTLRREIEMGVAGYRRACTEVCDRAECESKAELMDALLTPIHPAESWPKIVERFADLLNWSIKRPAGVETQHDRHWWNKGFSAGVADVLPTAVVENGMASIQQPSEAQMWARLAELYPVPKPVMSRLLAAGTDVLTAAAQQRWSPPGTAPAVDYGQGG